MAATSESSDDTTASISLIDIRLLSQSELYTLSFSNAAGCNRRIDDNSVIPKIDRSVFNESAGSRKQTFSRLRLAPRNNNNFNASAPVPAVPAPSSSSRIIANGENSQIIDLLQQLFGVEALPGGNENRIVPVQIELKKPVLEITPQGIQNGVDESQRKRKRGRPRRSETPIPGTGRSETPIPGTGRSETPIPGTGFEVNANVTEQVNEKKVEPVNEKVEPVEEKKGSVLDDIGDPFVEALIVRTQGMNTEPQLMEFLEGLNGIWGSDRKKRRIVDANVICGDLLPTGWKLILILQRRGTRASVLCRHYLSPNGRQFDSYKDVSSYLVSLLDVQDTSHFNSHFTDGSQPLSSKINMASDNQLVGNVPTGSIKIDAKSVQQSVGHIPTGGMKIDANASSHQEKQATMSLSNRPEKLSTYGHFNSNRVCSSESSMLVPNSEGNIFAGSNLISSLVGVEKNDGKLVKDDNQQIISSRCQSQTKDMSTNDKLQFSFEGSLVPSNNELNQTSVLKNSAEGDFIYNDLSSSSIDERSWDPNGYINNISFSAWPQDASESGGVDFTPNLYVANNVSDNHVSLMDEVAASSVQKRGHDDQFFTMDNLLHESSESNLFTATGNQHPSSAHDNVNNISAGTFGALKYADAGCMKPHLGINNCSDDVVINAHASPPVMQGISQSVLPGGTVLNQFDKKNDDDDDVNKGNKSCLSEMAKSEVEKSQTGSMVMPEFR